MEELLEQLIEEATASSLKGKLNADTGKTDIDIIHDMIVSLTNISLSLKASKSALERQVESYKGLELSYHTEVESLSKQIEGLKAISEAKAREIEGLERTISILTERLQESEDARSNMSLSLMDLEGKLSDKDIEIDKVQAAWQDLYLKEGSHAAEVAYYKQQAKKAEEKSEGLREEIESLRAQQQQIVVQQINNDNDPVGTKGFIKKLSKSDEDKIIEYYLAHSKRLTKAGLERFILETGIEISDNGFRDVLKRRGVYKRAKHREKKH